MQNSANLGGQIFEGLLYKKGAIVKNWKFRWFLLSPTQGEVNSDPAVCTGSMSVYTCSETNVHAFVGVCLHFRLIMFGCVCAHVCMSVVSFLCCSCSTYIRMYFVQSGHCDVLTYAPVTS